MPAWGRPARWSRSRTARSPAGAARRNPTSCSKGWRATLGVPLDKVRVDLDDRPRLLRPQRRRRLRHGRRRAGARRSASRCGCNTRATRAPAGTRRARPRSTRRAPASTRPARSSPTSSSARASRGSTSTPTAASRCDTLAGQTQGVALKSGDGFGVPAESYAFDQQAHGLGDHPAAARPLVAAAQRAPARSGRTADPLRQRVLHRRGGGGGRTPIRSSSACATSRSRATSPSSRRRPRRPSGRRGPRRAATRPATRCPAAASPIRNATARASRSSPRSMSTAQRQDLGAQVHRGARLRADHQSGRAGEMHRGQHRAGRQPHAVGGSAPSTAKR